MEDACAARLTIESDEATLSQRSVRAIWHPCTQMHHLRRMPPLAIESGKGPWLTDTAGNRYFDATSSWWSICLAMPIRLSVKR